MLQRHWKKLARRHAECSVRLSSGKRGATMGEPWETILRWAIIIGLALFFWSVSSSMEQIAKALTRLADAADAKRDQTSAPAKPD
jgi:hypothetical protein